MDIIYSEFLKILPPDKVKRNEPMNRHTTFRVGGTADYFVLPSTVKELKNILMFVKDKEIPYYVVGNGSNLLVSDNGFKGVIIKYSSNEAADIVNNNNKLYVDAPSDMLLSKLAVLTAQNGGAGFEFAAGIPGTLGGAVFMNAGAYDGEIKDNIVYADILKEDGTLVRINKDGLELGYRSSILQKEEGIVIRAGFEFEISEPDIINAKIKELNEKRREKQPLEYPSAGSTFKRPEGSFAGKLIMDAGLKGASVGAARVSEKHCGFIINDGGSSAADIYALICRVRETVYRKYGIMLEPEVKMIGRF